MHRFIADKADELKEICKAYDIKTMYVFGSACTSKFNDDSDVDILISFKDISIDRYTDNYFEIHYRLEELFGRKIDLLTENSLLYRPPINRTILKNQFSRIS
jgi:predicted nucleotidyltransferase